MGALSGKVAWITGAGSGIGEAGAMALAEAGAMVVLSGRRREALEAVAGRIGKAAEIEVLDVSRAADAKEVAERILARHGRIDILVNSAGLNTPKRFWKDLVPEEWDRVVSINLDGALYCITAVLPAMRKQKDGLVINISSWAGRYDTFMTGPAYNASKHGMLAMTASFNMEESLNGLRACVICPGEVATPIMKNRPIPPAPEEMARMLRPEDLGRTIRFVAEMPPHVCLNEIVIAPTWNRIYLGGSDIQRR
jgi:NADP-dependent 3-hydroxy acid dehydrogenase YdfG